MIARSSSKGSRGNGDNNLRALMGLYQGLSSRSLGSTSQGDKTAEDMIFNNSFVEDKEEESHHQEEQHHHSNHRTIRQSMASNSEQDLSHSSSAGDEASSFPLNGVLVICSSMDEDDQPPTITSKKPSISPPQHSSIAHPFPSSRHSVVSALQSDDESTVFGSEIESSEIFSTGSFVDDEDDSDMSEFGFTVEQRRSRRRLVVSDTLSNNNNSQHSHSFSRKERKTDLDTSGHGRSRHFIMSQERRHRHRHPGGQNHAKRSNSTKSLTSTTSIQHARRKMQHGGDHEDFCQRSRASTRSGRRLRKPSSKPDPLHLLLTKNSGHGVSKALTNGKSRSPQVQNKKLDAQATTVQPFSVVAARVSTSTPSRSRVPVG